MEVYQQSVDSNLHKSAKMSKAQPFPQAVLTNNFCRICYHMESTNCSPL